MQRVHRHSDASESLGRSTRCKLVLTQLVAEAIEAVDISQSPEKYKKKITSLVIHKANIFLKLGYLEDAFKFFSSVINLIGAEYKNNTTVENVVHMQLGDANDFLECMLGLVQIKIECSEFEAAGTQLDKLVEVISDRYANKDNDYSRRTRILQLNIARCLLQFSRRNEISEILTDVYQKYDHYRLLRCEDFMLFVQERICYLMDDCKPDLAMSRISNILSVIDPHKSKYWHTQFTILKAKCLMQMRRVQTSYDMLQEILHSQVLSPTKTSKLRDQRLFVDIHIELSRKPQVTQATVTTTKKTTRML